MTRTKDLTLQERVAVVALLSSKLTNGKLRHGAYKSTAEFFKCHRHTVKRVWDRRLESGDLSIDVGMQKAGVVGRRQKRSDDDLIQVIETTVPFAKRGSLRAMAAASKIPKTTLIRLFTRGALRRCNSRVKPRLTDINKKARVRFVLSFVHPTTLRFDCMYDRVFADEKWFYLCQEKKKFYLTRNEDDVKRSVQSKTHIPNIMFVAAVARPRWDSTRKRQFSGKLGIWSFIVKEPALRNSKNRSAGTTITEPISVDKEAYRAALIDKVIPSIKKSWPGQRNAIYIQQDNAKPHIRPDDPDIVAAGTDGGWNIRLQCQPPNSPDFNVLDLGFFNSIQSLQHQKSPKTIDELIDCVTESFNELMPSTLNSVYLTLQSVLHESLKVDGGNHFKIPHMKKEKLFKAGDLPLSINCDASVFECALEFST